MKTFIPEATNLTARKLYARDVEPDDVDAVEVPNALDRRRLDGSFRARRARQLERERIARTTYGGCPFQREALQWWD